jgi:carboxymethylenebutenolidase
VPGPIIAFVRDLLFSTRIGETARRLGYGFRAARSLDELRAGLASGPGLVMLDLTAHGLDLDAALAAIDGAGRPAPVLAWTTHALWKTTRPLHGRCDQVVTREQLTAELPELLRGYLDREVGGAMAIQSSMVSFESGPDPLNAHLALPGLATPAPAVVVIQEIWGLTPHIKDVADRFAREGYVALAPDMYTREGGAPSIDLDVLRKFALGIADTRIIGDLRAACAYLRRRPEVRGDRIAAVGFCMGGAWALLLGCHEPIQAVADFYGRVRYPDLTEAKPLHPIDYVPTLACPLLGVFAGADAGIPVEHARDLEAAGRRHGKTVEMHVYEGAPHAFFNDHRESYRAEPARDAWARTLDFFRRNLTAA